VIDMRIRLAIFVAAALALGACSSPSTPDNRNPLAASTVPSPSATTTTAPANLTLGSPAWYAWVNKSLGIADKQGHGPDPGSAEWNRAVQRKLGQEAPRSEPGSAKWQQSVDSLLRARLPASAASTR
jgi:hypothetical protein